VLYLRLISLGKLDVKRFKIATDIDRQFRSKSQATIKSKTYLEAVVVHDRWPTVAVWFSR